MDADAEAEAEAETEVEVEVEVEAVAVAAAVAAAAADEAEVVEEDEEEEVEMATQHTARSVSEVCACHVCTMAHTWLRALGDGDKCQAYLLHLISTAPSCTCIAPALTLASASL